MVGSRPGGGAAQPLAGWANALRRVRTLAHITQVVVLVVFSKIGPVLKNKYSKKYCQQNHCYVKKMTLQWNLLLQSLHSLMSGYTGNVDMKVFWR